MLSKKMGVTALAVLFVISGILTFALLWNATTTVTLLHGVERIEKSTKAKTVAEVLAEEGIVVGEHDLIWPEIDAEITEGLTILYKQAIPVTVKIGQQTDQLLWTTSQSVMGALREAGYVYNDHDIVTPDVTQSINKDQRIEVTKVSYGLVQKSRELKYDTVRIADDSLVKGTEKVINHGEPGEEVHTYVATYYNGKVVELDHVGTEVVEEPEEQIVHYGTLEPVSVGGYTFIPKKVLKNVKLTAYSLHELHGGKGPDHPLYGITRSGARVQEDHTIAVDPKLIPLGWWVYIDGYGLYKAEDTGGAIKGKIIDIYIEDLQAALDFGVKRNKTVYVVGPNKPSSN